MKVFSVLAVLLGISFATKRRLSDDNKCQNNKISKVSDSRAQEDGENLIQIQPFEILDKIMVACLENDDRSLAAFASADSHNKIFIRLWAYKYARMNMWNISDSQACQLFPLAFKHAQAVLSGTESAEMNLVDILTTLFLGLGTERNSPEILKFFMQFNPTEKLKQQLVMNLFQLSPMKLNPLKSQNSLHSVFYKMTKIALFKVAFPFIVLCPQQAWPLFSILVDRTFNDTYRYMYRSKSTKTTNSLKNSLEQRLKLLCCLCLVIPNLWDQKLHQLAAVQLYFEAELGCADDGFMNEILQKMVPGTILPEIELEEFLFNLQQKSIVCSEYLYGLIQTGIDTGLVTEMFLLQGYNPHYCAICTQHLDPLRAAIHELRSPSLVQFSVSNWSRQFRDLVRSILQVTLRAHQKASLFDKFLRASDYATAEFFSGCFPGGKLTFMEYLERWLEKRVSEKANLSSSCCVPSMVFIAEIAEKDEEIAESLKTLVVDDLLSFQITERSASLVTFYKDVMALSEDVNELITLLFSGELSANMSLEQLGKLLLIHTEDRPRFDVKRKI